MVDFQEFGDLLATIRIEWDKAEQSIKIAEQVGNQVVFPAIKELRYGGRRIIDALALSAAGGKKAKIRALLDDALFDCYRARHDAVDASISTIAAEMDATAKTLGYRPILDAFPDFHKLAEEVTRAQGCIASSRGIRQNRDELYRAIEEVNLPPLFKLYKRFKDSEKVMKGLAKEDRFWPMMGFWAMIGGVLVSIISIGVAIYITS